MRNEDNPKSIKYYVKRFLLANRRRFENKVIIDFPAGNGITSRILREIGAKPVPLDLFPEYFELDELICLRANINNHLPVADGAADALLCQEGIEHFPDQLKAFKEFNRSLKPGGTLLVTTPNYSNLISKLSYLFTESERLNSAMPPNEIDSIWMSQQDISKEVYFGHIFLIGIQKLRVLAKLSGFKIKVLHPTRKKSTNIWLSPFLYPPILLFSWLTYRHNIQKNQMTDARTKKRIYGEIFSLSVSPTVLLGGSLFVEFEKELECAEVASTLNSLHSEFGQT